MKKTGRYRMEFKNRKRALGVNLGFFDALEEAFSYLREVKEYGVTKVRMSFGKPEPKVLSSYMEEHRARLVFDLETVTKISAEAKEAGMEVACETTPEYDKLYGASVNNLKPYSEAGIDVLRLDWGYTPDELAIMTNNPYELKIATNASPANVGFTLEKMKEAGANFDKLLGWFNFYPHPGTGHSLDYLVKNAKEFKKYGLEVRCNVGMWCTVERLKHLSPARAAEELFATKVIDTVYVSGIPWLLRPEELRALGEVVTRDSIKIQIKTVPGLSDMDRKILFAEHVNRLDPAEHMVRHLPFPRKSRVLPHNTVDRPKYSVTIDNYLYGLHSYSGTLIINLVEMPADPRVNVVGYVIEEDSELVDMIGPGDKFILAEA